MRISIIHSGCLAIAMAVVPCQAIAGEIFHPDGRLPDRFPIDPRGQSREVLQCYVHHDGASLRAMPSEQGEVIGSASFLSHYFIGSIVRPEANGPVYWLVGTPVDPDEARPLVRDWLGWIRGDHCLAFNGSGPRGLVDERTLIYRKCMLINTLAGTRNVAELRQNVSFRKRPDSQGGEATKRPLFEILYVYAEDARGENYLLGTSTQATPEQRRSVLLGWAPRRRLCLWNTREAIEFNKDQIDLRRRPARLFRTHAELVDYLHLKPVEPLATEDLAVKKWSYHQARFPVVSVPKNETKWQGQPVRGIRTYKVGIIGDLYGEEGRLLSGRELQALRQRVRKLKDEARTVQVMFVIDGTFSMQRWFDETAKTVKSIMSEVGRAGEDGVQPNVEFSINFYRDDKDLPKIRFQAHPFGNELFAVEVLEQQRALGGHYPHESVFHGISEALKQNPFKKEAVKILILVGDDGNNPEDKTYDVDRIAEELAKAGGAIPVGFFAVAVGDAKNSYQQLFTRQARAISRRVVKRNTAALKQHWASKDFDADQFEELLEDLAGRTLVSDDSAVVARGIRKRFELAVMEMQFYQQMLDDLESGRRSIDEFRLPESTDEKSASESTVYGVVWRQNMLELIRQEQLEPLKLASEGVQLFHEGWVAEYDPLESAPSGHSSPPTAIRHVVLMHKHELNQLIAVLMHVVKNWEPDDQQQTWSDALSLVTREKISADATPRELMQKYLGINAREGVLALTLDEFNRLSARQKRELRQKLERKVIMLDHHYQSKTADYVIDQSGPVEQFRFSRVREIPVWWGGDAGSSRGNYDQRAWIDRDLLP